MKLYIETDNGQSKNHPAFEDNLLQAFGSIPAHWEPFERIERPVAGVYEVLEATEPTYQKIEGVWKDVWPLRGMTAEEIEGKQQNVKNAFANRDNAFNFTAWVFDEARCLHVPPVPYPYPTPPGETYFWSGTDNNWKLVPPKPSLDKSYTFDYRNWSWVESIVV